MAWLIVIAPLAAIAVVATLHFLSAIAGVLGASMRRAGMLAPLAEFVVGHGMLHVYPILPFIPEAGRAWRTTKEFLR